MGPVRSAKSVIYIDITQLTQFFSKGLIALFFLFVKTQVFE